MNETGGKLFLILLLFFSQICAQRLRSVVEDYDDVDASNLNIHNDPSHQVYSSIYKTANRFFCSFSEIENPELILYGTKSWVFPKQNTNLTLSYPSVNRKKWEPSYLVTGFNLLLFSDSNDSQGFIVSGGILQDSISLNFTCNDVTVMMYEFWLYGIPNDALALRDNMYAPKVTDMCFTPES